MPMITGNFQAHAAKLLSDIPVQQRQQLVTEMRDSIEIVHTSEYGNFLRHLFPAFHKLLVEGKPQFTEGPEQKIRNMLLEVLNRLPNNEVLRPHVQSMLSLCMKLLECDNEENAVICLRIIFDLHKNFRPNLEREVRPRTATALACRCSPLSLSASASLRPPRPLASRGCTCEAHTCACCVCAGGALPPVRAKDLHRAAKDRRASLF
jgi:hypothetical protein